MTASSCFRVWDLSLWLKKLELWESQAKVRVKAGITQRTYRDFSQLTRNSSNAESL
jgi:hypothetical protein